MTQYSLKRGLRIFEKQEVITKELTRLHDMTTFIPMDHGSLKNEQLVQAIASLVFLKDKMIGEIKGRVCANGSQKRSYIRKEDAPSPTAYTQAVLKKAAIEAHEKRDVSIFYILGSYLHTETYKNIIMVLKGQLSELVVKLCPKLYRKYMTINSKGELLLYVKVHKSLYGSFRIALLLY